MLMSSQAYKEKCGRYTWVGGKSDILKNRVCKMKENTKYSKPANTLSVQNLTEAFTMTEFLLKKKKLHESKHFFVKYLKPTHLISVTPLKKKILVKDYEKNNSHCFPKMCSK